MRADGGAYHLVATRPVTVYQFNALEYKGQGGPGGKNWSSCPGNQICAAYYAQTFELFGKPVITTVLPYAPEGDAALIFDSGQGLTVKNLTMMGHGDGTFDALVVTDAFHHFADQVAAARELHRVLRPGGGVLLHEFDPRGWMRLIIWGEKLLGEPGAFFAPDELCAYLAARGVTGHCESTSPTNYFFLGTVAGGPASGAA